MIIWYTFGLVVKEWDLIRRTEVNWIIVVHKGKIYFLAADLALHFPFVFQFFHNVLYLLAFQYFHVAESFLVLLNLPFDVRDESNFVLVDGLNQSNERDSFFNSFKNLDAYFCCNQFVVSCFKRNFSNFVDKWQVNDLFVR